MQLAKRKAITTLPAFFALEVRLLQKVPRLPGSPLHLSVSFSRLQYFFPISKPSCVQLFTVLCMKPNWFCFQAVVLLHCQLFALFFSWLWFWAYTFLRFFHHAEDFPHSSRSGFSLTSELILALQPFHCLKNETFPSCLGNSLMRHSCECLPILQLRKKMSTPS